MSWYKLEYYQVPWHLQLKLLEWYVVVLLIMNTLDIYFTAGKISTDQYLLMTRLYLEQRLMQQSRGMVQMHL